MALSGISVVLCCARQDADHLSVVVEHLRRESIEPVVLAGVDEDAHRLGAAVDAERGRALFVLCKSTTLGPSDLLRLEGIFGARKGPSHRIITTRLRAEDALGMVKDVRSALSGFTSSRSSFEDSDDGGSMREIVNISGISAVGSDSRGAAPMRERMASRQTPADPLAVPMRGKAGEHAARVPPHQSGAWQNNTDVGDTVSEKKAPLAPDPTSGGPPPASLLPEPAPPGRGALMPALVGGLLVAVLGVGALVLTRDPPVTEAARAPAPAPQAVTGTPTPAPAPERQAPPAGQETDGGPKAVPDETGDDGDDGDEAQDEAEGDAQDPESAISEAIASGEMRALDLLLVVAPERERPWRKAVDHCRLKRVNGVKGWRLPTLPELKKLRGARMLKQGRYWSSTRGAGESGAVYVLDRSTRKVELVDKEAEDVTVLCVRSR